MTNYSNDVKPTPMAEIDWHRFHMDSPEERQVVLLLAILRNLELLNEKLGA